jgi:hypothetical protein
MTEEKIKGALAKVSAEGVPSVRVSGAECVLSYGADAYEKRIGADFAALASVCVIASSSVVETLAPTASSDAASAKAVTQTVTLSMRPLPEKK